MINVFRILFEKNVAHHMSTKLVGYLGENYLSTSGSTPRDISTSMIFFITAPCLHG